MGAVRVRGLTAPDWSLYVGRAPHTKALDGLTSSTGGLDWC